MIFHIHVYFAFAKLVQYGINTTHLATVFLFSLILGELTVIVLLNNTVTSCCQNVNVTSSHNAARFEMRADRSVQELHACHLHFSLAVNILGEPHTVELLQDILLRIRI
jgi:hypothetical protein